MLARKLTRGAPLLRNARKGFLHYQPGEGRDREPVREPQPLGQWYQYRIFEDYVPDRQGEAAYLEPPSPYVMAQMFEYDNWHFDEPHEYLATGPLWLKPLALLFPFLLGLFLFASEAQHAREGGYGTLQAQVHVGNAAIL